MTLEERPTSQPTDLLLPILYFFGRILLFLSLVPNDFFGFGDFPSFFKVVSLPGWPFLNYWVEYPPFMPFLNALIYRLSGGQEFLFDFILLLIISLAGSGCLYLFSRIARRLYGERNTLLRSIIFFGLLAALPYTWWYFDLIPTFFALAAIYALLQENEGRAGMFIALGMLIKWFPALILPAVFRARSWKRGLYVTLISGGITGVVIGALFLASPQITEASLRSQLGRTSWQTLWALLDGNYTTGEYILLPERTNPAAVNLHQGNPAIMPPVLTLIAFAGLGLWLFFRTDLANELSLISFIGITWVIFFAWLPGWSPQWILYLLPLILLTLPWKKGLLWASLLVLITILEWPFFLARQIWAGLWPVVIVRMVIFAGLGVLWYFQINLQKTAFATRYEEKAKI